MNNSLTLGKKALVVLTTVAMVVWTLGVAAFAVPSTASAASMGSLVKSSSLSAVYYYGFDGQRYTFPNLKTYETWYSDFSGVQTISDSELAAIPLAGNVVYRPGSRFVKIQSDPKLYAVTPNGALRWIETEAVAEGLAGSAWNTLADDIPEVFFVDYTVGASLMSAEAYEGQLIMDGADKYVVWGGEKLMVSAAGQSANNLQDRFFVSPGDDLLGSLSAGADVSGANGDLNDPAQQGGAGDAPAAPAGGLSVSLSSSTPASATVPDGASQVEFMKIDFTANSGDATVNSLKLKMAGLGATANIGSVYLYEGDVRLTNARSVNSTTRLATFASLDLAVASGQTRTLSVVVDMAAAQDNGGDTMQFQIESASSITTDATVSGSFPVSGNPMTKSATDVGTVTVNDIGTVANGKIGETLEIANFQLQANSTEGFQLQRLRLEVDRASDHSGYELRQNNVLLGEGVVNGTYVDFNLASPFEVAQGNNRNFEVWAKVGGENGDGLRVRLEETTDLYAIGLKFGYGLAVTNSFGTAFGTCTSDAAGYDCSAVEAGQLTVAFNGPTTGDISENMNNVVVWEGTMTAANLVEIRDLAFAISGGTGTADLCSGACGTVSTTHNYQNWRLVNADTGATISGPYDMSSVSDTAATIAMTDDFTIPGGESWNVQLLTDVQDDASFTDISSGDTIQASWTAGSTTARDANNDSLTVGTDIIPGSNLAGNTMTLRLPTLNISIASNPASSTYVRGTNNVDIAGFSFAAGTAADIEVSSATFKLYGDDDGSLTNDTDSKDTNVVNAINSCSLYDSQTGALVDGPESPGTFSSGTGSDITFSGFAWTIPAAQTYKVIVRCNLANLNPDTTDADAGTNDAIAAEIDAAADITAVDSEGNSVTAQDSDGGAFTAINSTQTVSQTIANAGTLTVAIDGDSPNSTVILSNSTGVTTSKFKLTASNEAFTVDRLTVDNTTGSDTAVSSVELHYENAAGEDKIATGFFTSSAYTFEGLSVYVPKDDDAVVTVKVNTGDVSAANSASGDLVGIDLSNDDSNDDEFRAVGAGSGSTLNDSSVDGSFTGSGDGVIAANDHEIRKTKPTISLASGSPSGAAIVGLIEVLRFNVTADSRGDVNLEELTFELSSTDNASSTWNTCAAADLADADIYLYDSTDAATDLASDNDVTMLQADGSSCTTGGQVVKYININFDGDSGAEENVAAGTTKTFILKINVSNTTAPSAINDDSMRVDIPDEVTLDNALTTEYDAIVWNDSNATSGDMDANSIGAGANDQGGTNGIDGDMIKNLPVIGGSLIF